MFTVKVAKNIAEKVSHYNKYLWIRVSFSVMYKNSMNLFSLTFLTFIIQSDEIPLCSKVLRNMPKLQEHQAKLSKAKN